MKSEIIKQRVYYQPIESTTGASDSISYLYGPVLCMPPINYPDEVFQLLLNENDILDNPDPEDDDL